MTACKANPSSPLVSLPLPTPVVLSPTHGPVKHTINVAPTYLAQDHVVVSHGQLAVAVVLPTGPSVFLPILPNKRW